MKLKIKVTKEIINEAKFCGITTTPPSKHCAIALAVRDIFPNAEVGCWEIGLHSQTSSKIITIPLPDEAQNFISKFDMSSVIERVNMREIEFDVDLPEELINEINIEDIKNSKTLELVS